MNCTELIKELSNKTGIARTRLTPIVDTLFDIILDTVIEGEKISIVGFGVFEPSNRKAKKARNMVTNEEVIIPARTVPTFKFSKSFKDEYTKRNK